MLVFMPGLNRALKPQLLSVNLRTHVKKILFVSGHLHDNWRPETQRAALQQSVCRSERCAAFHLRGRQVFADQHNFF